MQSCPGVAREDEDRRLGGCKKHGSPVGTGSGIRSEGLGRFGFTGGGKRKEPLAFRGQVLLRTGWVDPDGGGDPGRHGFGGDCGNGGIGASLGGVEKRKGSSGGQQGDSSFGGLGSHVGGQEEKKAGFASG